MLPLSPSPGYILMDKFTKYTCFVRNLFVISFFVCLSSIPFSLSARAAVGSFFIFFFSVSMFLLRCLPASMGPSSSLSFARRHACNQLGLLSLNFNVFVPC